MKTTELKSSASRRALKRSFVENDLAVSGFSYNTSEYSVSTCDTLHRSKCSSSNNLKYDVCNSDSSSNEEKELDGTSSSNSGDLICSKCDKLTIELTEMRMQHFNRWLNQIKTLEDMLCLKESTIEKLQSDIKQRDQSISKLNKSNLKYQQTLKQMQAQFEDIKFQLNLKNNTIDDLSENVKINEMKVSQQSKLIEKLERNAKCDSDLIKQLRTRLKSE